MKALMKVLGRQDRPLAERILAASEASHAEIRGLRAVGDLPVRRKQPRPSPLAFLAIGLLIGVVLVLAAGTIDMLVR